MFFSNHNKTTVWERLPDFPIETYSCYLFIRFSATIYFDIVFTLHNQFCHEK